MSALAGYAVDDYNSTLKAAKCADEVYELALQAVGAERVESWLRDKLEDLDEDVIERWWEKVS